MKQPHFFLMVTQSEWKTLFSVVFVTISDHFKDCYPLDDYPTPGYEGPSKDYLLRILRSARFLALGHGFHFSGLQVQDNGSIGGQVIEPGNENYVDLLRGGGLPNLPLALNTAIETLLSHNQHFDVSPLRACLAQIYEDLDKVMDWQDEADPGGEIFKELRDRKSAAYEEAQRLLGLKPEVMH